MLDDQNEASAPETSATEASATELPDLPFNTPESPGDDQDHGDVMSLLEVYLAAQSHEADNASTSIEM